MRKYLIGLILGCAILFVPHKTLAVSCTQAQTFTTGMTLTDTVLNANPARFVNCFLNIDNTNIGAGGIFASQIIPTTVGQATFGGALGYTFGPFPNTIVPFTVKAPAGQMVDIWEAFLDTTKELWLDSNGVMHFAQTPSFATGGLVNSATSPITFISNVIACPTCLTTAGGQTITLADAFNAGITAGSSTYGPTSATVNGTINVNSGNSYQVGGASALTHSGGYEYLYSPTNGWIFHNNTSGSDVATISATGGGFFAGINVSGLAASSNVCTDSSRNLATSGCSSGGDVSCTTSSTLPCYGTWTCTITTVTCSTTNGVPSGAKCVAGLTGDPSISVNYAFTQIPGPGTANGAVTSVLGYWVTISGTTLTEHATSGGNNVVSSTAVSGNITCL